jgi:hypothetical protein
VLLLLLLVVGVTACGSTTSGFMASGPTLARCPKWEPEISGGSSPGGAGETVKEESVSGLVCRWRGNDRNQTERAERMVRGPSLTHLVKALNSLAPGEEGEYACPSGPPLNYLVDLRYADGGGIEVEAEYDSCDFARTEDGYWWASGELEKMMNALLAGWVPYRHRSKPPFFTTP